MKTIFPPTKEEQQPMTIDQLRSEQAYIDGNGCFCIKLDGTSCLELFSANGVFMGVQFDPATYSEEYKVVEVINMREKNAYNEYRRFKIIEVE
jgi:hypothetical protein